MTETIAGGVPMRCAVFTLIAVCLVAMATGCRLCAHPYDYCGPTVVGGCQSCDPYARAGSILSPPIDSSGTEMAVQSPETVYDELMPVEQQYELTPPDVTTRKSTTPRHAKVSGRVTWR